MTGWRARAACAELEPGPWDWDAPDWSRREALAVCAGCAVRSDCRELGVRLRLDGVYGGVALVRGVPDRRAGGEAHRRALRVAEAKRGPAAAA